MNISFKEINHLKNNEYYLSRQQEMESNVISYPRKFPLCIVKAKGCWITDANQKLYLDCLAGAGTLALGHNHPVIKETLQKFLDTDLPLHSLDITTPVKDEFSEYLLKLINRGNTQYSLQFCGPTGADAVEAAIKLAKIHTGRSHIISFSGGYHGMTHGALALTGNLNPKQKITGLMPDVHFMPYPHEYRCPFGLGDNEGIRSSLYYFEKFINDVESGVKKPAAIILEPIQGEGGVVVAPDHWLKKISEIAKKNNILLIVDEVQTGFSRTGKLFAHYYAEIEPDIIIMSKAIGGGLPLALLAIKKDIDSWQPGGHTGTFRGNQLAMAAGLTTLKILSEESFLDNVNEKGKYLINAFRGLQSSYKCLGNIRGRGLMIGIEIVDERQPLDDISHYPADNLLATAIQNACFENGLLLEKGGRGGTVLRILCPLIISQSECVELIERFETSLKQALDLLRK